MTNLEMSVRDTLERLEKRYLELTNGEDWVNVKDTFDRGVACSLHLAIEFIKTDLNAWGEIVNEEIH